MFGNVESIARNSNYVSIAGVRFNKKDVKIDDNGFVMFNKDIVIENGTGYMQYTVEMNDGTLVSYREQEEVNKAKVSVAGNGSIHFQNINGAKITDTPNDDNYDFCRCKNITVNAKREHQVVHSPSITGAYSYTVPVSTDRDTIRSVFCENMQVNITEGYDKYLKDSSVFGKF